MTSGQGEDGRSDAIDPELVDLVDLVEQLNRWTRDSGLDPEHPGSETRSTGESNAAIDDLKRQIAARGATVRWDAAAHRYELGPAAG